MRSAPTVSYPVGRSRFQAGLLGLLGLGGVALAAVWRDPFGAWGWRQVLFATLFGMAWLGALRAWLKAPAGVLSWDGQGWTWQGLQTEPCSAVRVHLDLQGVMLLGAVLNNGRILWLWPQRSSDGIAWTAFRRAVFHMAPALNGP